jgi:hypothetical protein
MTFVANMRPDPPDLRDRIYSPTLRVPEPAYNARPFEDPDWRGRVRYQGSTSACTGFALAAMVEALHAQNWVAHQRPEPAPEPVSPYMLYYLARRYDEFPGEADTGSSARAAMKAWQKHGACRLALWSDIDREPSSTENEWAADGFRSPLGAYYRVDHESIADLHAAVSETSAVYVTATIHQGWYDLAPGSGAIPYAPGIASVGGHAFLLVGYDGEGFWIQNSWGDGWGQAGFARLSYADWAANAMDAWVGQLGVFISGPTTQLAQGAGLTFQTVAEPWRGAAAALLSPDPNVSAQQLNPYVINLENNGTLSERGKFRTREQDLENLVTTYLESAVEQWGLTEDQPIDVAIYAHGGLTAEAGAEATARHWVPALFAARVLPIFVMWETGLLDTLRNCFEDAMHGIPRAGVPLWDRLLDAADDRVESLVAGPGTFIWDQMKENAAFATLNPAGGLRLLWRKLVDQARPELRARLRLHLIGHSAGAIFHSHLLPSIVGGGVRVDGLYFMAPACRVDLFRTNVLPHYQRGQVAVYTQYHLDDRIEQNDTCTEIYHKSLLYLVSNAFERRRGTPILGLARDFLEPANGLTGRPAGAQQWDWIVAPTLTSGDPLGSSLATSHGSFSGDEATRQSVIRRITARRELVEASPSAAPSPRRRASPARRSAAGAGGSRGA